MRRYIKELKPTKFSDLAAMVALYRPGPMEHIPRFIKSKHGLEPITYPHPALERILEETYGVIVYQDQVLFVVREFAGYSLGQADIVRKAMGKKIPEIMQKERVRFIEGAQKKGFSPKVAEQVFDLIEPFAGYAFNKAHSVCYAMIAYQTAYLKANYPVEYMTALLLSHSGQQDKVAAAVADCQRMDIKVLPPDVNRSEASFSIEDSAEPAIRFGLADIKNVGAGAVAVDRGSPQEGRAVQVHRGLLPAGRPARHEQEGDGEPHQGRRSGLPGGAGGAAEPDRPHHVPVAAGAEPARVGAGDHVRSVGSRHPHASAGDDDRGCRGLLSETGWPGKRT